MKRRKTKKVKMVRILGETVRKGSKSYRILLDERRKFLRRQRDPESSYYGIPISEILKSNRRRGLRRNKMKGTNIRVRVGRPSYGKPFYGDVISVYRRTPGKMHDEGVYSSHHGRVDKGYLIQRSPNSGATWYTREDFRLAKRRSLRRNQTPLEMLRDRVSGAVERGEAQAIAGVPMEYARQIPRRDRPMRGRGFDKRFDVSAGSDYKDLQNFLATGRPAGMKSERKIGANTLVRRYNDGSIGVILYSTRILHYHPNGEVDVNFGGYMTPTTFSRINALIPYGWNLRKKGGKLALENSWGQRAVIRKPRAGEEYAVRLTSDKAYLVD